MEKTTNSHSTASSDRSISRNCRVPAHLSGLRFDQIAAKLFPEFSRGKLQAWILSGELTINGKPGKPKQKVLSDSLLDLQAELITQSDWLPETGSLDIVFQDSDILVLNKPTNLVVHPAAGIASGTLVNRILGYCPGNECLPRGGIVHRLDKDTTGLMVVAKSLEAHAGLVAQLQEHRVTRLYRALVCGDIISGGSVSANIGRHPTARTKMAVVKNGGKEAITHYRVEHKLAGYTDLSIQLETGRTHQIRVHMAHLLHPLIGDKTYNMRYKRLAGIDQTLSDAIQQFPRQALHAKELHFTHPCKQEDMSFSCDLPNDYITLLNLLQERYKSL